MPVGANRQQVHRWRCIAAQHKHVEKNRSLWLFQSEVGMPRVGPSFGVKTFADQIALCDRRKSDNPAKALKIDLRNRLALYSGIGFTI